MDMCSSYLAIRVFMDCTMRYCGRKVNTGDYEVTVHELYTERYGRWTKRNRSKVPCPVSCKPKI